MDRFKLVSDGSIIGGTKIYAPDGTDISGHVRAVEFRAQAGEMPTLLLEILKPIVEIELPDDSVEKDYVDGEPVQDGEVDISSLDNEYRRYARPELTSG
jgi:hypothetical protein